MEEQLCGRTESPAVNDGAISPATTTSVRKLKREAAAQRRKLLAAQSAAININSGDEINTVQQSTATAQSLDRDGRYQRRRRKDPNSANRKKSGSPTGKPKNANSAKQFGESTLPTPHDNDDGPKNDILLPELDPNNMVYTDPQRTSNQMLWSAQPSAAANCRRRQAVRGPRSGAVRQVRPSASSQAAVPPASAPAFDVKNCTCGCDQRQRLAQFLLHDQEDHRVLSTEFHAAATQATVKVTILAAGFVIGARGISARLIGQVTGAAVHSWTESGYSNNGNNSNSNRVWQGNNQQPQMPHSAQPHQQQQQITQLLQLQEVMASGHGVPVRLFRIEGKKPAVHSAVALIQDAVAKYKELCELKRRGEFVQREHVIGGVEFYYQPPPRKAFANQLGQPGQLGVQFCGCRAGLRPRPCCSSAGDAMSAAAVGAAASCVGDPNFSAIPNAGIFSNFSYPQSFHHMHHHNPTTTTTAGIKPSTNWFLQQQQQQHFSSSAALQPFVNNFTLRHDSGSLRHAAPQLRSAQDQPSSFRWPLFRQKPVDPSSNLGSYMSPSSAPSQGFGSSASLHGQLQSLFDEFSSPAAAFRQYTAAAATSPCSVMENHSQDQLSDYSSSLLQKLQVSSTSSSANSSSAASSAAAAAAASKDSNRSNCSLFSVFGNGGHPVPIARASSGSSLSSDGDHQNGTAAELLQNSNNCKSQMQTSTMTLSSAVDAAHGQMMSTASSSSVNSEAAGLMSNSERVPEYCLFGSMQSIYNDLVDNQIEPATHTILTGSHGGLMIDTGLGFPNGCASATAADVARACLCSTMNDQN